MNKKVPISDICYVFDGPHATPQKTKTGPIYLGIKAISEDGVLTPSEYTHLSVSDYYKWTKRVTPQKDDIVFSYEATLGRYAIIPEGFYGCLGRRLAILRAKNDNVNVKWLYYYFKSPEWKTFIANQVVNGSTVDRISIDDFPTYPVFIPERIEQDRIAKVLSNLDDKISLNNSINTELEKMARTLYDYWFVQFDFPNAEGKPYRASGGEMVYSDVLKREIPKGWHIKKIKDICILESGYPFRSETYCLNGKYKLITIKNVQDDGLNLDVDNYVEDLPDNLPECCKLKPRDILMSLTGNVARIGRLFDDQCLLNQRVAVIKLSSENLRGFVYSLFKSNQIRTKLEIIATGSSQDNLSPIDAVELDIPYCESVILDYNRHVDKFIDLIVKNFQEIKELTALRDFLLPLLMNGQVKVEAQS